MENDVRSELENYLEANKDSQATLLVTFSNNIIHQSKKEPVGDIIAKVYGLIQALTEDPNTMPRRYVDFNKEGAPVFIPFSILKNSIFSIELDKGENKLH